MRLALMSDQHGNDVAFRAVVEDIERIEVDQIVCLGDVAQGGGQPAETLDRLRSLGCPMVLGNADAFLLEVPSDSSEPIVEGQLEVREWTLSQLDATHLDLIRSFQPTVSLDYEGTSMLFFHGSPRSYDDVLIPEPPHDMLASCLQHISLQPYQGHGADLLAGGHTHKQWTRRIDDALFVNPGSAGFSYDLNQKDEIPVVRPVAEYALVIVGDLGLAVEFRQVPYSTKETHSAARANGRPHVDEWISQWVDW
jgi:predicted phosphodiesterase